MSSVSYQLRISGSYGEVLYVPTSESDGKAVRGCLQALSVRYKREELGAEASADSQEALDKAGPLQ